MGCVEGVVKEFRVGCVQGVDYVALFSAAFWAGLWSHFSKSSRILHVYLLGTDLARTANQSTVDRERDRIAAQKSD